MNRRLDGKKEGENLFHRTVFHANSRLVRVQVCELLICVFAWWNSILVWLTLIVWRSKECFVSSKCMLRLFPAVVCPQARRWSKCVIYLCTMLFHLFKVVHLANVKEESLPCLGSHLDWIMIHFTDHHHWLTTDHQAVHGSVRSAQFKFPSFKRIMHFLIVQSDIRSWANQIRLSDWVVCDRDSSWTFDIGFSSLHSPWMSLH